MHRAVRAGMQAAGTRSGCNLNLGLALEAVLYNGRKRTPNQPGSGKLLGVETGDPHRFQSFDEFMGALKKQIARQIQDGHIASCWVQWIRGQHFPLLLESIFTDACIERGLTAHTGGAKINVGPGVNVAGGIGTIADSLAAIKKLVYEEKKISMAELLNAIEADFQGYETLQNMLIHQAPKYGNDIDYVDDLARDIWQYICEETKSHITHLGNRNYTGFFWPMSNIFQGTKVWATPDGRKAGAPFSNHFGPTDGKDTSGPIANINSVTKLGIDRSSGAVHNLYLVNINTEADWNKIVNLAEAFFTRGGSHLQLNCQDKKVFIDAQKHPEKYAGLMVRVAGYVAYFVELPKSVQDQIIGRTDQYV